MPATYTIWTQPSRTAGKSEIKFGKVHEDEIYAMVGKWQSDTEFLSEVEAI